MPSAAQGRGRSSWLNAQSADCLPCLRPTVSAKRKWMPRYTRALSTSSARCESERRYALLLCRQLRHGARDDEVERVVRLEK